MSDQVKCDYCEQEMPFNKMYSCTPNPTGDYKTTKFYGGHKRCMMALHSHYQRTGKIMTEKEIEAERFDPSI
jgi:hypothetical protein